MVLDPADEFSIEAALQIAEANPGSTVTLVSMGPDKAQEAIRRGLAMGTSATGERFGDSTRHWG